MEIYPIPGSRLSSLQIQHLLLSFLKSALHCLKLTAFPLWFHFANQVDICSNITLCYYCKEHWVKNWKILDAGRDSTTNKPCELQEEFQSHWLSIFVPVKWDYLGWSVPPCCITQFIMKKINILTVNHSIIIKFSNFIFRSEDILHISCSFSVFSSFELRGTLATGVFQRWGGVWGQGWERGW